MEQHSIGFGNLINHADMHEPLQKLRARVELAFGPIVLMIDSILIRTVSIPFLSSLIFLPLQECSGVFSLGGVKV